MENTEKVLFKDDQPQWYIAMGENWVGPISASEVYQRVTSQQITWAHYVWKPGDSEWKRLCDVKTFVAAVPEKPSKALQREVKETSQKLQKPGVKSAATRSGKAYSSDAQGWFLYYNETQFGPFAKDEVVRLVNVGKISPRAHAWRSGMSTWTRIEKIESLASSTKTSPSLKQPEIELAELEIEVKDQRKTPRRPMVAKILLANSKEVTDAMCRDISVGGMQVLTDHAPGKVGEKIKLNVSATSIEPFVAEGMIVRLLEDQKGFSFRFDKLSDGAKRSIEKYINSPQ